MHKSATKCNETLGKWCKNKHGASKIIDTLETYHPPHHDTRACAVVCGMCLGVEPFFLSRMTGLRNWTVTRKLTRLPEWEMNTSLFGSSSGYSFHLPVLSVRLPLWLYKRGRSSQRRYNTHIHCLFVPEHCAASTAFPIPSCGVHRKPGQ
jgi:hypothetical protein